jgi:16S rRNA (guanine527-N7)-methyltransferase
VTRPLEALAKGAAPILARPLEPSELAWFTNYLNLLVKWQKVHRIVGSADPMWIVEHLFLDSLLFLTLLPPSLRTLPGIPIKIVSRELEITLVESRRRRAAFLSSAVRELKLERAHVVEGRIENLLGELEGRFEGVVMRCAGDVGELIPLAARLVESHGVVVAAGPPRPKLLALGEWVTVPGVKPGTTRRFAIYRRP